jgi:glycosyltransferase involved in cell wall biosynthesis
VRIGTRFHRATPGSSCCVRVVSTFPPRRDGIARYADQLASSLAQERSVVRIGLPGSDADRVVRLDGGLRPLRLLAATRQGDEILLMWHPEFYISGRAWARCVAYIALGVVLRRRDAKVFIHEPDASPSASIGVRRPVAAVEEATRRWLWACRAELVFHSKQERGTFLTRFPQGRRARRLSVVDHGQSFRPYTDAFRQEARLRLGWQVDGTVFLCLGFLGRHKGFDRALRAFARLPEGSARLHVIGSPLYDSPEARQFVEELRELVESVPGSLLEERFVDDAEFDLAIRAADAVLVPYRSVASSGVAARARMLGTTLIATPVGALPEQLGPDDILVASDDELVEALFRLSGASRLEVAN